MNYKPVLINITYAGQSGNWFTNIDIGSDDNTIRRLCEEAVRGGEVPGVFSNIPGNAFANFVIDRFNENGTNVQTRFVVRPKVPFG
jgi:hypothetical protein